MRDFDVLVIFYIILGSVWLLHQLVWQGSVCVKQVLEGLYYLRSVCSMFIHFLYICIEVTSSTVTLLKPASNKPTVSYMVTYASTRPSLCIL